VIEAVRVMASERMNLTVVFTIGWRVTQGQTLEGIRALKACPERSEGRRLGENASPEGLTPSFRTGAVAEPAL